MPRAKSEIRRLAEKIAAYLFTSGGGSKQKADRLVLEMPDKCLGGAGWCERAVADVIELRLKLARKRKAKTNARK